ncbi:hypothetical protein SESBI_42279 [Sesbania bispinosa]|nr:hypothetical protein SESBI_42279 [Sesbania bispinosa]
MTGASLIPLSARCGWRDPDYMQLVLVQFCVRQDASLHSLCPSIIAATEQVPIKIHSTLTVSSSSSDEERRETEFHSLHGSLLSHNDNYYAPVSHHRSLYNGNFEQELGEDEQRQTTLVNSGWYHW